MSSGRISRYLHFSTGSLRRAGYLEPTGSGQARTVTVATGYQFPWNNQVGDYDTSRFCPQVSEGRITKPDIDNLFADLKQNLGKYYALEYSSKWSYIMPAVAFAVAGIVIGIGVWLSSGISSRSARTLAMILIIMAGLLHFCGTVMGTFCFFGNKAQKRSTERSKLMEALLKSAQETIFYSKGVSLSMQKTDGTILLNFDWKEKEIKEGRDRLYSTESPGFGSRKTSASTNL